jgi:hypothetical protein
MDDMDGWGFTKRCPQLSFFIAMIITDMFEGYTFIGSITLFLISNQVEWRNLCSCILEEKRDLKKSPFR